MKRISLFLALIFLLTYTVKAQTVDSLWNGYLSPFVQTGGTAPNFTVQGQFVSNGGFTGAQISLPLKPRLIVYSSNKCYELPFTALSGTGSIIAGTVTDPSGILSAIPSGSAIIFQPSSVYRVGPFPTGISASLQGCLQTYNNLKIDSIQTGGITTGDKQDIDVVSTNVWVIDTGVVNTLNLAANAVDSTKLQANSVQSTDIGPGQVMRTDIATNAVDSTKVALLALPITRLAQSGATNNQVMTWNTTLNRWIPAALGGVTTINGESGDVTDYVKTTDPVGSVGGDITGTIEEMIVTGIQGQPLTGDTPASGEVLKWNGTGWAPSADLEGIEELRIKELVDSIRLGDMPKVSGRFLTAKKDNLPLTVAFAGDSQFDQYQRNIQGFLMDEWGSIFRPNGPGYCAASTQSANVQGFGYKTVVYTGTWTQANTITNTPPIVEEGINGRYSQIAGAGTIKFETEPKNEWADVEKFQNIRLYTKANGAEFTYSIDGGGAVSVTTLTHGGVNVTTITGLSNTAHSVLISYTSGTLRVYGVSAYNTVAGNLTIHRIAQGSSSFESWANRMSDTSYVSKLRTLFPVPQTIFFNLGSNDVLDAGNLDSLRGHVNRFLTKITTYLPNTDIIVVTPLDQSNTPFIDMSKYRDCILQEAKNYKNVKVCNLYDVYGKYQLGTQNGLFEADSVHWSTLGAKLASPILLDFLLPSSSLISDLLPTNSGNIYYVEKKFNGFANTSNAGYSSQLIRVVRGSSENPWPDPWSAKQQAMSDISSGIVTSALIYIKPGQIYLYGDSLAANNGSTDFAGTATSVDYMVSSATRANANLYSLGVNYYFSPGSQLHNLCAKYQIVLFSIPTGTTSLNFNVSGEGEFYSYYGQCQSPSFDNLLFSVDNPKADVVFNFNKIGQAQWQVFFANKVASMIIKGKEVRTAGNVLFFSNNTTTTDSMTVDITIDNMFNGEGVWGGYCDHWYVFVPRNDGPMTFNAKIGNLYNKESGPIMYTNRRSNYHVYNIEIGNVIHYISSQGYHPGPNDCMFYFGDGAGTQTVERGNKINVRIGNMTSDLPSLYYTWFKSAASSFDNSAVFDCGSCQVRNSSYAALQIEGDTLRKDRNTLLIKGTYSSAGYALSWTGGGNTLIDATLYGRNANGAVNLNGVSNTLMLKGNIVATGTNSIYAAAARSVKIIGFPASNKTVHANVTQQLTTLVIDSGVGW